MSLIIKMDPILTPSHLERAIGYIMQEYKTEGRTYSNSGVTPEQIHDTFLLTKEKYHSTGKRQGYHFKLSFSKDETISQEDALRFMKDWAQEYLKDEFDYCLAAHSDREHTHMHLVFNSVKRGGGKFRYDRGDWEKVITPLTNALAEKYGTGKLKTKEETKIQESEIFNRIEKDIDEAVKESSSYEEFKQILQREFGYQVREGLSSVHGTYLALTPPGRTKAVRTYRLKEGYMPVDIERKIQSIQAKYLKGEMEGKEISEMKIYRILFLRNDDWYKGRKRDFIPYEDLSIYQQYHVKKMLEARRLYRGTGASLQMREQAETALSTLIINASFVCRYDIRSEKALSELIRQIQKNVVLCRHGLRMKGNNSRVEKDLRNQESMSIRMITKLKRIRNSSPDDKKKQIEQNKEKKVLK